MNIDKTLHNFVISIHNDKEDNISMYNVCNIILEKFNILDNEILVNKSNNKYTLSYLTDIKDINLNNYNNIYKQNYAPYPLVIKDNYIGFDKTSINEGVEKLFYIYNNKLHVINENNELYILASSLISSLFDTIKDDINYIFNFSMDNAECFDDDIFKYILTLELIIYYYLYKTYIK